MQYISWAIYFFLTTLCITSIYYNIRFAKIILKMEDDIGECLDILDEKYAAIAKILEIPIFFDSPQVRQVIKEIKSAKESLLYIANRLSNVSIEKEKSINAKSKKNS